MPIVLATKCVTLSDEGPLQTHSDCWMFLHLFIIHNRIKELVENIISLFNYQYILYQAMRFLLRYYNDKKKYPVIYVLDGDVLLNAVHLVHDNYYGGFMPEMIIVGVSNSNNRTRDLTTSKITERRGMPYNEENGEPFNFSKFLINELIPHIEDKYPVTNYRTIIGHSYGGLFATNLLVKHTEVFQNYLLIDPSLDWDNQKLLKESELEFKKEKFEGKNFLQKTQLFRNNGWVASFQTKCRFILQLIKGTSRISKTLD